MIAEHKSADGRAQYEPAFRGRHSHLLCRRCGELLDLDQGLAEGLRRRLLMHHGFQVDLESYPLPGLCASCRR
jgi:Fe2+ or Zn2+ uptake regulation protein